MTATWATQATFEKSVPEWFDHYDLCANSAQRATKQHSRDLVLRTMSVTCQQKRRAERLKPFPA